MSKFFLTKGDDISVKHELLIVSHYMTMISMFKRNLKHLGRCFQNIVNLYHGVLHYSRPQLENTHSSHSQKVCRK